MTRYASATRFSLALTLGIALLLCARDAAGSAIPHGTLELLAENQWIAPGHRFFLGLHFELEKGWHIYWQNPGDSGAPPRISWQLPAGLAPGAVEWPVPRRLGASSIVDFGYDDAVTLIVPVHASASLSAEQPARLGAQVKVLVCRDICIPGNAELSLALTVKSQPPVPDGRSRELFARARKSVPRRAPAGWRFGARDATDSFILTANLGHQTTQATFFPLAPSQIDNAAPQKLEPAAAGFRLTLRKSAQLLKPVERLKGVLVLSADQGYLIDVPVGKLGDARNNDNRSRRNNRDETLDSLSDARRSSDVRSSAAALGS